MNTERFIARRIINNDNSTSRLSKPIVRISVLAITLGIAVMILTLAVVTGFQNEIKNKLIGFVAPIQIIKYDANSSDELLPISRNQSFIPLLKTNDSITHLQVFANKSGIIKTDIENEGVVLKGVGTDYNWSFIKKSLITGDTIHTADTLNKSIIISKHYADKLHLKMNDKVVIHFLTQKQDSLSSQYIQRAKAFHVCGIYETGLEDIDKHFALVDIQHIQKLNYWQPDQVAGFEVELTDYTQMEPMANSINEVIDMELIAETVKEHYAVVFSWLELQDINGVVIIVLMLMVAGINMISALLILILERTGMIGLLKALGAKNASIRKIFMYNAAYLIARGLLWGNVLGISIALIQQQFGLVTLDQATYYVSVIPVYLNIWHILLLNAGTMFCCLIMLLLPSLVITKISPVKAIQYS